MTMQHVLIGAVAVMFLAAAGRAEIVTESVEYEDGETTLVGYVAYDDTIEGERPGVLVIHEWYGLNDYAKMRARELAEMGYVAFAADMYGQGKVATSNKQAAQWSGRVKNDPLLARRRGNLALRQLKKHKLVDADRTAAIGYCFGGTMVLELARSGADVGGVVSFHGGLGTKSPALEDQVKARVLVCHGAADPYVPREQVNAFEDEMDKAKADWTLIKYSGAVHSFTNPSRVGDKATEGAAYHEEADKRSWRHMQVFFDEVFGEAEQAD